MPRYFFHLKDEQGWIKDEEGMELPDLDAAKEEARATATALAKVTIREGKPVDGRTVVVLDEENRQLHLLAVRRMIQELGN